jgi:hypothetical protein
LESSAAACEACSFCSAATLPSRVGGSDTCDTPVAPQTTPNPGFDCRIGFGPIAM